MSFFSRLKRPREVHVRPIRFLGEQDGQPERNLKHALARLFEQHPGVARAYLVLAIYEGDLSPHIVLALAHSDGGQQTLADAIARIFAGLFDRSQLLDILFLTVEQEPHVAGVCVPFFSRLTLESSPSEQIGLG